MTSTPSSRASLFWVGTLFIALISGLQSSSVAEAQEPAVPPDAVAERASALWPSARAAHRATWDASRWEWPEPMRGIVRRAGIQLATHTLDLAVPIDSVTLEMNLTGVVQWLWPDQQDQVVHLITGNPEVGALFTDEPMSGVRYQLGGAVALPLETTSLADGRDPPPPGQSIPLFPELPVRNLLLLRSLGWNAYRVLPEAVTLVARGRLEVVPHAALLLALGVDVPVTITFDGEVAVRPQGELIVAARIDELHLVGIRTEVVTLLPFNRSPLDTNVVLEPFARVGWTVTPQRLLGYARLGVRLPLGPAFPFVTESPMGWMGASLELGLSY